MSSLVVKRDFELEYFIPERIFALRSVTPRYKYEDNKKTDEITGYVYEGVNTSSFDTVKTLVEGGKKPVISNDELQNLREAGSNVYVEFKNARLRPYYSTVTNQIEDSIKADGVSLVETN